MRGSPYVPQLGTLTLTIYWFLPTRMSAIKVIRHNFLFPGSTKIIIPVINLYRNQSSPQ